MPKERHYSRTHRSLPYLKLHKSLTQLPQWKVSSSQCQEKSQKIDKCEKIKECILKQPTNQKKKKSKMRKYFDINNENNTRQNIQAGISIHDKREIHRYPFILRKKKENLK